MKYNAIMKRNGLGRKFATYLIAPSTKENVKTRQIFKLPNRRNKSISKHITYTADMPAMSNMSPPQKYSFVQLTFQRFCRHNPIAEGQ